MNGPGFAARWMMRCRFVTKRSLCSAARRFGVGQAEGPDTGHAKRLDLGGAPADRVVFHQCTPWPRLRPSEVGNSDDQDWGENRDRGHKSVERLGVELRSVGIVSEVQRKTVVAWYSQRNEAAHGRFDQLINGEVERMIDGVRDFVSRHPA